MTKKPGIVDPWRQIEPLKKPTRPVPSPKEKKNLSDIDFDADLAIPGKYVIRSKHASISVTSVRVKLPKDALEVLADCLLELTAYPQLCMELKYIGLGIDTESKKFNMPSSASNASSLSSDTVTLLFNEQSLDHGILALVKILRASISATNILNKHGVVPMLVS